MLNAEQDWIFVKDGTDTSDWHGAILRLYDYWKSIKPERCLPGRQHFDPLDIPDLLPRLWLLDVVRPGPRFRFRLVGTSSVKTLGHDPTGLWLDESHPIFTKKPDILTRYILTVETRTPTYRRGLQRITLSKDYQTVENIFLPMASDGETVDLLVAISVAFNQDGTEA